MNTQRRALKSRWCLTFSTGLALLLTSCGTRGVTSNSGAGQAAISANPTTVSFGNQAVGATSAAQTVTVTNTGTATLNISAASVTPAQFQLASGSTSTSVAAGASAVYTVTFAPDSATNFSGTLTITSNASTSPTVISLTGTGTGQPAISANPTTVSFGNQAVGTTSAAQTVTVTNTGTATLNISAVSVAPAQFHLASGSTSTSVAAGASAVYTVTFAPNSVTNFSGSLTIISNATTSPTVISLTGTGTGTGQPAISANPTTLSFGNQAVGTTSAAQTVTITNTGTATLNISAASVTPAQFQMASGSTSTSVAAGASTQYTVTFTPDSATNFSGGLTITSNAPTSPTVISLTGTGTSGAASNCAPTVSLCPLNDLLSGTYRGYQGGLYENGSNAVPAILDTAARAAATQIQPLDVNGNPSPTGSIIFMSVGMSNANYEWAYFQSTVAANATLVNSKVNVLQGAEPGAPLCAWFPATGNPTCGTLGNQYDRIANSVIPGTASVNQVQAVWLKDANKLPGSTACTSYATACNPLAGTAADFTPTGTNPVTYGTDAAVFEYGLGQVLHAIKARWPNVKLVFVTSRIYAGYATSNLNPEPFAYEYGFAFQRFIQAQVNQLRSPSTIDPVAGDFTGMPIVVWSSYIWANATNPTVDTTSISSTPGLIWCAAGAPSVGISQNGPPCNGENDYLTSDYTHPSDPVGRQKVANILFNYFRASPYSAWFRP